MNTQENIQQASALDRIPRASFHELAEKIKKIITDPFVLQIGAMDGVFFDLLNPHLIKGGWQGLLVEPLPDMFAALQKNYASQPQLRLVNCAIGEDDGSIVLRRINPDAVMRGLLPPEALGITTMCTDRGLLARDDYKDRFEKHVVEIKAPCRKLQSVLDEHQVKKIDVVVIDAEGADWMIAQQLDFKRYDPSLLCIEYSSLKPDEIRACCLSMSNIGYGLAICQEDMENLLFYKATRTETGP